MCNTAAVGKMLQVRNIPDRLHRELRRRAKSQGRTLTDYARDILEREVSRPPADEVFERIESRGSVDLDIRMDELIRRGRGERDAS